MLSWCLSLHLLSFFSLWILDISYLHYYAQRWGQRHTAYCSARRRWQENVALKEDKEKKEEKDKRRSTSAFSIANQQHTHIYQPKKNTHTLKSNNNKSKKERSTTQTKQKTKQETKQINKYSINQIRKWRSSKDDTTKWTNKTHVLNITIPLFCVYNQYNQEV